jgi:hypothetical protein
VTRNSYIIPGECRFDRTQSGPVSVLVITPSNEMWTHRGGREGFKGVYLGVEISTGYGLDDLTSVPDSGRIFTSPYRPDQL